jgi:hypothetical protein
MDNEDDFLIHLSFTQLLKILGYVAHQGISDNKVI